MSRFVIITPGRSGSTFLAKTLNNHSGIACEEEIFNRSVNYPGSFNAFITSGSFYQLTGYFFNREKLSTLGFNFPLKWLIAKFLKGKPSSQYGFKISLDQLFAYPPLFKHLKSYKVIYLTREDKHRLVLSLLAARKTGDYESFGGSKVWLDPVKVKDHLAQLLIWEEECLERFKSAIHLTSEQLFENQVESLAKTQNFLDLLEPFVPVKSLKTHPEAISDWVENYEEIERILETETETSLPTG